jgi:threonine dehydratase
VAKLELLQHTGTFKVRGALLNLLGLSAERLAAGATAVSAGNHALAVAWAAKRLGTTAKVVMPRSADPIRISGCRDLGAEVVLADDVHAAFEEVHRIEREEGRTFVHPFEGPTTATGTATLGLEICEQVPGLDAVVVPIGGGGLCAGIATAVKALRPGCRVYGVEPEGADTMHRSFASGRPEGIDRVQTIADSLGAPHAAPYTFGLCREHVDALVRVSDDELCLGIARIFHGLKLAVEPAGAAATAALFGPLRERLRGATVAIVVCGTNLGVERFTSYLSRGEAIRVAAHR